MEYRGYQIIHDGTFGYKEIKPTGRGSVPLPLRGIWTTSRDAQKAIDAEVNKKDVVNAEANVSV